MSKLAISNPVGGTGVFTFVPPATNTNRTITLPDAGGQLHTSQSVNDHAAMPTVAGDPIVASGSNTDGKWTRWADGTQTCDHSFNGYDGGSSGNIWNYPQPFISDAYPLADLRLRSGAYGGAILLNANERTLKTGWYKYSDTQGSFVGASDFRNYIVICSANGRWK